MGQQNPFIQKQAERICLLHPGYGGGVSFETRSRENREKKKEVDFGDNGDTGAICRVEASYLGDRNCLTK